MTLTFAHLKAMTVELARFPGFVIPTVLFPPMLLLFFGVPAGSGREEANLILASFMAFAVLGIAFFQFGVGIADDRSSPWHTYLRMLPSPAWVMFSARVLSALAFAVAAGVALVPVALLTMPVQLDPEHWFFMVVAVLLGAIPFGLAGIALGYLTSAKSALAIANLIFLPLSYMGGLWTPPQDLPGFFSEISPFLPTRQWAELIWSATLGRPMDLGALVYLLVLTFALGLLALYAYRQDEGQRYR